VLEPEVDSASVIYCSVCPSIAHHESLEVDVSTLPLLVASNDSGSGVGDVVAAVAFASYPEVVACKLRELLVEALHEQVSVVGCALIANGVVGGVLAVAKANTSGTFEVKPKQEEERV
jgi:hypothetical protein